MAVYHVLSKLKSRRTILVLYFVNTNLPGEKVQVLIPERKLRKVPTVWKVPKYIFSGPAQLFNIKFFRWWVHKHLSTWSFFVEFFCVEFFCGVFSGPHFPLFGLKTKIYSVNSRIHSKCRIIRTRKNWLFGQYSRSDQTIA